MCLTHAVDPLNQLKLIQQRRDLMDELDGMQAIAGTDEIEAMFVGVAKSYSGRFGISYGTWREIGVNADVLRRAGISRAMQANGVKL